MLTKNVAVINLLRIGDVLQSIPLIRELKRKNCKVTLICQNIDIDFLKKEEFVDEIIKIDIYKLAMILKKEKDLFSNYNLLNKSFSFMHFNFFDQVFNLNSMPLSYKISLFVSKDKKYIFGPTFDENNEMELDSVFKYLYSISSERRNSLINLVELYISYLPYPITFNHFYKKHKQIANKQKIVIITISTGEKIREFSNSFYIDLINYLIKKDYKIILTGVDIPKGNQIYASIKNIENVQNLVGKTTLEELFNLYKNSDLLISPDTGTIHLAALTSIKILGLYNISALHHLTGAYSSSSYFLTPKINCYPCEEDFQPCGNLKCKSFFTAEVASSSVEYILGEKPFEIYDNLNFWQYKIDKNGGYQKIIYGEDISKEQKNILTAVKFFLFKIQFNQVIASSFYWIEFQKIYNTAIENNYFLDLYRFIENNEKYHYLLPLIKNV